MKNNVSGLFVDVARSIDALIGKGNVVDADFTNRQQTSLFQEANSIADQIATLKELNRFTDNKFPYFKRDYIEKQIQALKLQLDMFENPANYLENYKETTETLLDVSLPEPLESEIDEIRNELAELLNTRYSGTLANKLQQWKDAYKCSVSEYLSIVQRCADRFSEITFNDILPQFVGSEAIEFLRSKSKASFELVDTKASWTAYNYYKGNYQGNVAFNSAVSFNKNNAELFIAHEAFPGHHTSGIVKEYFLEHILQDEYLGLKFLSTPSCIIEEGIADTGFELMRINEGDINQRITFLVGELHACVTYLVAYRLFVDKIEESEAHALLRERKLLIEEGDVTRGINFIKSWKYYVPSYKIGRDFVRDILKKSDDKASILKLLYLCPIPSIIKKYVEKP